MTEKTNDIGVLMLITVFISVAYVLRIVLFGGVGLPDLEAFVGSAALMIGGNAILKEAKIKVKL